MDFEHIVEAGEITPASPLHNVALATYILFGLGLFFPVCTLIGLIVAYVKRADAAGSGYATHFTWLIRTFWITLGIAVVGFITLLVGIGALILVAVWIWHVYRLVAGFLKFNDRLPIDRPTRFI
ncbi:MAG: hypothetical protein JO171_04315 [Paludibacterium sp.]|uniref:DUF4870 family protein n=1 Tax=Paludibacterium sp. TaxID=1917523 RepID=UPI0025F08E3A|nr:hypothetical protein [Paludibacterium sp.]MBV8046348.1 hypothetical protein [Paludibacterium sp.]MBV8649536.1 hypothetical protein [Paludibacterium sp.]